MSFKFTLRPSGNPDRACVILHGFNLLPLPTIFIVIVAAAAAAKMTPRASDSFINAMPECTCIYRRGREQT
jgi:hypothetical protein